MKRKRDIEEKNEGTHSNIEKKQEREKANSIVVVVVVTITMPLLTCLWVHVLVIIRGDMYIAVTVVMLSNVTINIFPATDVTSIFYPGSV